MRASQVAILPIERGNRRAMRRGFTLLEVLLTTVLTATLRPASLDASVSRWHFCASPQCVNAMLCSSIGVIVQN